MSDQNGLRRDAVYAMTIIVALVIAACTTVVVTGHDVAGLIGVIGGVTATVLLAFGAVLNERTKATDEKVNGRLTQALENHQETVRMLDATRAELATLKAQIETRRTSP